MTVAHSTRLPFALVLFHALLACSPDPPPDLERAYGKRHDENVLQAQRLEARTHALARKVEALRGLRFSRPCSVDTLSRAAIVSSITASSSLTHKQDGVVLSDEFAFALGMVPRNVVASRARAHYRGNSVDGFFQAGHITLSEDSLDSDATLVHELFHCLQEDVFGARAKRLAATSTDHASAWRMFVEADAVLGEDEFTGAPQPRVPITNRRRTVRRFDVASHLSSTPRHIAADITAPYLDGAETLRQVWTSGGWKAVNGLWKDPPTTTEQMLHPDKLRVREPAIKVSLPEPDLSVARYRLWDLAGHRMSLVGADTVGELGVRSFAESFCSLECAANVASGWGGDTYGVYMIEREPFRTLDPPPRFFNPPPLGQLAHAAFRTVPSPRPSLQYGSFARWLPSMKLRDLLLVWKLEFDTLEDADELAALLQSLWDDCEARPARGPIAWITDGTAITILAGPYSETKNGTSSTTCEDAHAMLASAKGR